MPLLIEKLRELIPELLEAHAIWYSPITAKRFSVNHNHQVPPYGQHGAEAAGLPKAF